MASSLTLKRLLSSTVLPRSRTFLRTPVSSRLLNTNAVKSYEDGVDLDRSSVSRRRDDFFSEVFDPFSPTRSVGQVLNLMDQLMENPLFSVTRGMGASRARRGWDIKERDDAFYLRIDMPGQ